MRLRRLLIEGLRIFERVEVDLAPGWNTFVGPNGAGKTTLLEAAYLLSRGRSFRTGSRDVLSRSGTSFSVFAEYVVGARVGTVALGRSRDRQMVAKLDGEAVAVGELYGRVGVVCFEPGGAHALLTGPSEDRRRTLDWGVFHVEHAFLQSWRAYQRALLQRNHLLRIHAPARDLGPWDAELSRLAGPLERFRAAYVRRLGEVFASTAADLLPELGVAKLRYEPGFDVSTPLDHAFAQRLDVDRARGFTGVGPHRADWRIAFDEVRERGHLSRGQEKLCAFALAFAQARLFAQARGEWPLFCADDMASELDEAHGDRVVTTLKGADAQILATATEAPKAAWPRGEGCAMFHVEQGCIRRLL